MKVGVEIVTGFLGAGKTAFINSLINEVSVAGEKIIVIQLEHGNTKIIEKEDGEYSVKLSNSDCTINNLKKKILNEVTIKNPTSIIIEYNGTDKLEELYSILESKELKSKCKINSLYYICDGPRSMFYIKNMGELLVPFIESSNLIVINNCKDMKENEIGEVKNTLENINLTAYILTSEDNEHISSVLNKSDLFEKGSIKKFKISLFKYF